MEVGRRDWDETRSEYPGGVRHVIQGGRWKAGAVGFALVDF